MQRQAAAAEDQVCGDIPGGRRGNGLGERGRSGAHLVEGVDSVGEGSRHGGQRLEDTVVGQQYRQGALNHLQRGREQAWRRGRRPKREAEVNSFITKRASTAAGVNKGEEGGHIL